MENKMSFMEEKPVAKLLMSMALPMMLSMLMQSLYNIIDSIFVARLSTDALTAISLAYPLQNVVLALAVGIGVGINATISINLGAKKQESANKAASIGMVLTVIHCFIFVITGIFFARPFIELFTSNKVIIEQATQYLMIVLCCSFGMLLQIAMEKIFQALGQMKITMALLASGCIINIILDPIMIFGLLGFPALGVAGAALATVIGQISAFILYLIVYLKKDWGIKISPKYVTLDLEIIKKIYYVGIPSTIMTALPSVLVAILNSLLATFSQVYVAVLGIYFKLQTFIYMPTSGIVQGMRPIISYNFGAKKYERVEKTIKYSLMTTLVIMIIGTVLSLTIPKEILMLFSSDNKLIEYGIPALRIISLGFIVSSFGVIFSGVFEALGMGKESLIISLIRQFILTISLSFILSNIIGVNGIWLSFVIGEFCGAIVAIILYKHTWNKVKKLN